MSSDQALKNMFVSYKNNNQAFTDVRSALATFKDLRASVKPFTYTNGQTKSLVNLEGTIPISYKSKTYNIPVIIWTHDTHPYNAPMVFVQPTATMNIKAGPHVDRTGLVTIPYIHDWRQGQSDMITLIQVLCMVFGESPPVFAKPKNQPPQPTPVHVAPQPSPMSGGQPPYPTGSGPGMPTPYQSSQTSNVGYPPAPGYPSTNSGYPPVSSNSAAPSGYNPYGPSSQTPAYPPTSTNQMGSYGQYGQGSGYGSGMSYPSTGPGYPPTSSVGGYPTPTSTYPATSSFQGYSQTSYPNPGAQPEVTSELERQKSFGLSEDEIRKSLLSAVEDKMRRRLKDLFATHQAEMDVLRKTQEDLNAGQTKLAAMDKTLETETAECETSIAILESKIPILKEAVEKSSTQTELPPEQAIETTAPLYRQLLQVFCEEQAIEDTLYILGDALRREVIPIELYLKKVRDLSRKQFMLRALIQKCREKAKLSDVYS